eukprot:TRINITY_DN810_c0_g1_i1.p1 TRINITY_DN810_c0_g1~~TRINITY_DN810_c0_g1_i1.p1  ORF type:complete len:310 (+),score=87.10 TRINITY_DN810_c0_g1_i1:127-930(+)
MVKLCIAVIVALLSYVDAQAFASASASAGKAMTMTSTSVPKPYKKIMVEEPKPSPKPIVLKKKSKSDPEPSPKPSIKIVADGKKEKEIKGAKKEDKVEEGSVVLTVEAEAEAAASSSACSTIAEAALATPELSTLVAALQAAGLVDELASPDLVATVLAPTNAAFEALLEVFDASLETVLADPQLANILLYHVIGGAAVKAADLEDGGELTTLVGQALTVDLSDGVTFVGFGSSANVIAADVETCKSVVHVIDTVLLPDFNSLPASS